MNNNSNPSTTLTVPAVSGINRRFSLLVASVDDNDTALWTSTKSWRIPASIGNLSVYGFN